MPHNVECLPHNEVWLDHCQRPTQERSREVHAPVSEDHNQVLQGGNMSHVSCLWDYSIGYGCYPSPDPFLKYYFCFLFSRVQGPVPGPK